MSIPDFQQVMLPLLKQLSDRQGHSLRDLIESVAEEFKLTDSERRELLPSGSQFIFNNRVGWARTYMKKAGLILTPKTGILQITDRGIQVLKQNPNRVDVKVLKQFPEFVEFQKPKEKAVPEVEPATAAEDLDPQENLEVGYQRIRKELSSELLTRIKACSPNFFERLVVDLLLKAGYGGSRRDFGEAIGKPGDGGIDAVIQGGQARARRHLHSGQTVGQRPSRKQGDTGICRGPAWEEGAKRGIHYDQRLF